MSRAANYIWILLSLKVLSSGMKSSIIFNNPTNNRWIGKVLSVFASQETKNEKIIPHYPRYFSYDLEYSKPKFTPKSNPLYILSTNPIEFIKNDYC
jgi:hypothetical protein